MGKNQPKKCIGLSTKLKSKTNTIVSYADKLVLDLFLFTKAQN